MQEIGLFNAVKSIHVLTQWCMTLVGLRMAFPLTPLHLPPSDPKILIC